MSLKSISNQIDETQFQQLFYYSDSGKTYIMEGNVSPVSSMASDTVTVKEEPVWEQVTGSHSVSEAAALAGLYTDHEVKEELVIGPEVLQPPDAVFTAETLEKSDPSRDGCHQDHTYAKTESPDTELHVKEEVVECLKEEAEWEALAVREQPVLRDCAVRLERIDSLEALLEGTRRVEHNADVGNKTHTTTNIATEKESYVCDVCEERFDLKTQLMEHVMTHIHRRTEQEESMGGVARNAPAGGGRGEGREPTRARGYRYSCEICKKKFPAPNKLKVHERIHTGARPFACEICKRKFTVLGSLNSHKRIHTGERPFGCEICQQKFVVLGNLNIHKRIHTGERPFSCGICQRKFARSSSLKTHERTHTGEKPFPCGICKQKFAQSGTLKTHERTHTGAKPFSCGICKRKFALSSYLKKHERTHTGAKPFSCGICKQKFTQSSHLKRHERTHMRTNIHMQLV